MYRLWTTHTHTHARADSDNRIVLYNSIYINNLPKEDRDRTSRNWGHKLVEKVKQYLVNEGVFSDWRQQEKKKSRDTGKAIKRMEKTRRYIGDVKYLRFEDSFCAVETTEKVFNIFLRMEKSRHTKALRIL